MRIKLSNVLILLVATAYATKNLTTRLNVNLMAEVLTLDEIQDLSARLDSQLASVKQ